MDLLYHLHQPQNLPAAKAIKESTFDPNAASKAAKGLKKIDAPLFSRRKSFQNSTKSPEGKSIKKLASGVFFWRANGALELDLNVEKTIYFNSSTEFIIFVIMSPLRMP